MGKRHFRKRHFQKFKNQLNQLTNNKSEKFNDIKDKNVLTEILENLFSSDFNVLEKSLSKLSTYNLENLHSNIINKLCANETIIVILNTIKSEKINLKGYALLLLCNILLNFPDKNIDLSNFVDFYEILFLSFQQITIEQNNNIFKLELNQKERETLQLILSLIEIYIDTSETFSSNSFVRLIEISSLYLNNTLFTNNKNCRRINFSLLASTYQMLSVKSYDISLTPGLDLLVKNYEINLNNIINNTDVFNFSNEEKIFLLSFMNNIEYTKLIYSKESDSIGLSNIISKYKFFSYEAINILDSSYEKLGKILNSAFTNDDENEQDNINDNDNTLDINLIEKTNTMEVDDSIVNNTKLSKDDNEFINSINALSYSIEIDLKALICNLKVINDILITYSCPLEENISDGKNLIVEEIEEELSEHTIDEEEELFSKKIYEAYDKPNKLLYAFFVINNNCSFLDNLILLAEYSSNSNQRMVIASSEEYIVITELAKEIDYISISILSNIFFNFRSHLPNEFPFKLKNIIEQKLSTLYEKLKVSVLNNSNKNNNSSIINYNASDIDTVCLLLSSLREMIDYETSFKKDMNVTVLFEIYKMFKDNQNVKISTISLIGKICHARNDIKHSDNELICNYLMELFQYEQNDIELLCHVINAIIDVYSVDDYNDILQKSKFIEILINGNFVNNLNSQIKTLYNQKIINSEVKQFCKDLITNLKAFISYKQKLIKIN